MLGLGSDGAEGMGLRAGWGQLLYCGEVPWLASGPHLQLEGFILRGVGRSGAGIASLCCGEAQSIL